MSGSTIPDWNPRQIRHSFGTRIRKEYGAEHARILLGHAHIRTTEIYAEEDEGMVTGAVLQQC